MFNKYKSRFVGSEGNRSDSDNGSYVAFVEYAIKNPGAFERFRRNKDYCKILEHASFEEGSVSLDVVRRKAPHFLDLIERIKRNDCVGSPVVHDYAGIGAVSPSTLRYLRVAAMLYWLFGDSPGEKIVEIGVGYGGQLMVNDLVFPIRFYELIDLSPVLELTKKYLECFVLNCGYQTATLNEKTGEDTYDLAISNYAFSELPSHIQEAFIKKILKRSKRGFLTMNSGLAGTQRSKGKCSLDDLRNLLPALT
jgi:hypothetical protein